MKTLSDVLDPYLKIRYDDDLYLQLKSFRIEWGQKSSEYIDFLGNNLTGVNPIRFSIQDDRMLMDILGVAEDQHLSLQQDIYKLPGIDKNFKVSSNYIYVTLMYIIHKFINSRFINKLYREDAIKEVYYIFAYKAFSSLLSNYFKYNINESTARAVVERLTNKSLIKKLHNWQSVFEYRAKDVCDERGVHYKKLKTMTTLDLVRIINDLQGKLREMLKNVYSVLMIVVDSNEKIKSTNTLANDESGREEYASLTDRKDKYITYINSIIGIPTDFIRDDLTQIVAIQMKYFSADELATMLYHISTTSVIKDKSALVEVCITSALEHLAIKKITSDYIRRSGEVLSLLKSYYNAGNYSNKQVKEAKKTLIYALSNGNKIKVKFASTYASGIILYIAIRALLVKN